MVSTEHIALLHQEKAKQELNRTIVSEELPILRTPGQRLRLIVKASTGNRICKGLEIRERAVRQG